MCESRPRRHHCLDFDEPRRAETRAGSGWGYTRGWAVGSTHAHRHGKAHAVLSDARTGLDEDTEKSRHRCAHDWDDVCNEGSRWLLRAHDLPLVQPSSSARASMQSTNHHRR
jgi:hypothetical protein